MKNLTLFLIILCTMTLILSKISFNFTIKDDEIEEKEYILKTKSNLLKSFIEAKIESDFFSKTVMNLCLGTTPQCFDVVVQTNSFYIMVSDYQSRAQESKNKFDYSKSTTIVRNSRIITFNYYTQQIKGQEASDILTIGGENLSRVNFLLISTSGKYRTEDGFIGLGYTPSNDEKKFSIIQQLFENGIIPHKVFSQKYTDNYNGHITFGEIPKYIVEDYTHYGRCHALNKIRGKKQYKNNNWECYIDYMYYGDGGDDSKKNNIAKFNKEQDKTEVLFLSYRKRSFLPYKIFELIGKTYLKNLISEQKCNTREEFRYTFYECDLDVKLEQLNLVFDSWEIQIDGDKLFEEPKEGRDKKEFMFYYKKNFEKFLLGRSILKEFEMVYDYANKQIGFYHTSVKYVGKDKVLPPKVFDFLNDDKEFEEKKVEQPTSLLPETSPEELKETTYNPVAQDKKVHAADVLRVLFEILIIFVGIILIGFLFIYGMKMRKKEKIKKSNLYLKKQRLMEMK